MDTLLGLLTGGAGGILGTIGQGVFSWLKRRETQAHELAMREQDRLDMEAEAKLGLQQVELEGDKAIELAEAEGAQALRLAQTEGATARDVAAQASLRASYSHDKATYGGGFVDKLRGIVRPYVTLTNSTILSFLAFMSYMSLEGELAAEVNQQIITTFLGLISLTITWWFGGRIIDKIGK